MRRWVFRSQQGSPSWRTLIWLTVFTSSAVLGAVVSPVASQTDLVDAGLDTIMQMTPTGFQRSARDRLPTGPMSTATFNSIGLATVTVGGHDAVFYGASFERSDGALIIFLGMSSSHQPDAQTFADGVISGTLPGGEAFSTGIIGAAGIEGRSNGLRAAAIAFARHGRGFAVLSFGENVRDDGGTFAKFVAGLADSTPTRSDAKPVEQLRPAAVVIAAGIALAIAGVAALWRFGRQRRQRPRVTRPTPTPRAPSRRPPNPQRPDVGTTDTLEHPVHTSPRPSPRPNPR